MLRRGILAVVLLCAASGVIAGDGVTNTPGVMPAILDDGSILSADQWPRVARNQERPKLRSAPTCEFCVPEDPDPGDSLPGGGDPCAGQTIADHKCTRDCVGCSSYTCTSASGRSCASWILPDGGG